MGLDRSLTGPLHVVGTGLLGTSIALAARARGLEVWLSDHQPDHVQTAISLGAGIAAPVEGSAQLTVVAVPPLHVAGVVVEALRRGGVVTDVGSVKALPLEQVQNTVRPDELSRYVGSHPMAGSERSGPLAASPTLFEGRPWALSPHPTADPAAVALVGDLIAVCGAIPVPLDPLEHDLAVARTSHVPHLMAVLAAGQLTAGVPDHLLLSGQGVRDVTRVAGGDPNLYSQIIRGNAKTVAPLLREVQEALTTLIRAVEEGADDELVAVLKRGNDGTRMIPGKHGAAAWETEPVLVVVPDRAGALARLLVEIGEVGVNVEDLRIDHDPGRPSGVVELQVAAGAADGLHEALAARGWQTHR